MARLRPLATAQQELRQIYPAPGEVEHDPEEIWTAVVSTVRAVMAQARITAKDVAGIGITNQRETTVIWDRNSGKPIHNAIVWQDRRTADLCEALHSSGHENEIARKTGLLLDPYFSASKIAWLLEHVDGAKELPRRAGSRSVRSIVSCSGGLPGARRISPMRPTPRVRFCSTSEWEHGMATCAGCSAYRSACFLRCAIARPHLARHFQTYSARPSAFWAWPAINRRRPSGRAALRRAW